MMNSNGLKFRIADVKGFTLLEALFAIGIFLLLIVGVSSIMSYSFRSKNIIWEQLSTQNEGRKAVQDFINELRTASASSIGAFPVESAATSSLVFYTNLDTDALRERVRYFIVTTTFKRGVIKPSGTPLTYNPANEVITEVAHDVNTTSSVFYYYGQNYDGITVTSTLSAPVNVTQIRVVGIKLRLEENPQLTPAPLVVEGKVEVRNLKSN